MYQEDFWKKPWNHLLPETPSASREARARVEMAPFVAAKIGRQFMAIWDKEDRKQRVPLIGWHKA